MPKITGKRQTILKVCGTKERGFRISIPLTVYLNAEQPRAYTFHACYDGTLVYQPVKP